jgi:hypothetical protein
VAITTKWTRFCHYVVDQSGITSGSADTPISITQLAVLPLEMITADHKDACATDGSDIRVTTDQGGKNECPIEIVSCALSRSSRDSTIEIRLKLPPTATEFWIWYCNLDHVTDPKNVGTAPTWYTLDKGSTRVTEVSAGFTHCIRTG